ncbi:MAG: hypothetical protein AABW46_04485 [Nanoarchaeota archaeon]
MNTDNTKDTEGENLIADFFEERGIGYVPYKEIKDLKEDDKFFRVSDFYLPDYKVYVEFLGQWNNPNHKKRYQRKIAIYNANNILCVYLWPNNLGNLDWIIKRRITAAYLKHNKRWLLFKYELFKYIEERGLPVFVLGILIYYLNSFPAKIVFGALLLIHLFTSLKKSIKRIYTIKRSEWVSGSKYNNVYSEEQN